MPDNIKWNGAAFQAKIRREFAKRINASAIVVQNRAKELISVEGTGQASRAHTGKYGWGPAKKYRKKQLIYNFAPSAPGEPPRVQTGRLRGSVSHERTGLEAHVGTNVKYGRWLELGTSDVKARPWLRRSLYEMVPAIRAIVGRPIL